MRNPLFILIGLIIILIGLLTILLSIYFFDEVDVYNPLIIIDLVFIATGLFIFIWAIKEKSLRSSLFYLPALVIIIIGGILVFTIGTFIGILSISFGVCFGIFGWLNEEKKNWRRWTNSSLIILSLVILLIAHLYPTCTVDAKVPIEMPLGGTSEAGLDAKLYLYGFDVEAGVEGGMMGGMGVRNERFFVQGPGPDLPERLGIIMNSYKTMTYELTTSKYDSRNDTDNFAKIEVKTHIDRVPIWIDGISQTCTITVTINEAHGVAKVDISNIRIELWTIYDEEKEIYETKEVILEKSVADVLRAVGDSIEYSYDITSDTSEKRMGIVARIDCAMTDVNGEVDENPREPFTSDGHPNPNNVYLATRSQAGIVALMVAAFPMFIIAAILSVISVVLIFKNNKKAAKYLLIAGILVGLGFFFYRWGVHTLLDMMEVSPTLDKLADKYFSWNWTIYLVIPSSVLLIGNWFFVWIGRVIKPKETKNLTNVQSET